MQLLWSIIAVCCWISKEPLFADGSNDNSTKSIRGSIFSAKGSGKPKEALEFRIVGGSATSEGKYPFFVQGKGCGGSLISPRVVLTAAHCSSSRFASVRIGSVHKNSGGQVVDVIKQIVHPLYQGQRDYDFRLLILSSSNTSRPTALLNSEDVIPKVHDLQTVIGTGHTSEGGANSDVLKEADVQYISNSDCTDQYGNKFKGDIMMCAMVAGGGTDACQGDSGGPIIDRKTGRQVGVVSWGSGCARPNAAGVYARVSSVYSWIQEQQCLEIPEDCPDSGSSETDDGLDASSDGYTTELDGGNYAVQLLVRVRHDKYPLDVSWAVTDNSGQIILQQAKGSVVRRFQEVSQLATVTSGNYKFQIFDSYGDGLREVVNGEEPGGVQIFLDGKLIKMQGAFYESMAQLEFTVQPEHTVSYGIDVQYDRYPREFEWKLVDLRDNSVVEKRSKNSIDVANNLVQITLKLIPGVRYRLDLRDGYGDGLQSNDGYVRVWYRVNDHMAVTLVDNQEHFYDRTIEFSAPITFFAEPPCMDTSALFDIDARRSCTWLNDNLYEVENTCRLSNVATVCPRTCEACGTLGS